MEKYFNKTQALSFHLILILLSSCNGQNNNQSQVLVKEQTKSALGQPKLIKSQGSNESNSVWCELQDKAGNLWFGTTGDGVYRFNGKLFINYTTKDGLNSNSVWSILEDTKGNIWFGTKDGISRFDGVNIAPILIPNPIRPVLKGNMYYSSQSTKNTVWSMLQDKKGKIWFGTGDGVYCFDGSRFTRFLYNDGVINKDSLQLKMVDRIFEDKKGIIWFASGMPPGMEGVSRYDGKSIISSKPNGDGWIRSIVEDKNGILWFGGRSRGNFIYNGKNFVNFTDKVGIGNPILADKSGNIWFNGVENNLSVESDDGIWCYNGKTFKNFNTKDGMSKYFVWSMFEDRIGNIWIGTRNTGLYKYNGKTFTCLSE